MIAGQHLQGCALRSLDRKLLHANTLNHYGASPPCKHASGSRYLIFVAEHDITFQHQKFQGPHFLVPRRAQEQAEALLPGSGALSLAVNPESSMSNISPTQ